MSSHARDADGGRAACSRLGAERTCRIAASRSPAPSVAIWRTFPSGLLLYIGYLMVAFTPQKRALHDYIAGTLVLRA